MKSDTPSPLSQRLAQLFEQGFFRPLARPSAQLYVDCAARHEKDLADLRTKHAADNESFDKWVAEAKRLTTALGEFHLDSDEADLKQKLNDQKDKRKEQSDLLQAQQSVRQRLRDLRHRWTQWLKRGAAIKLDGLLSRAGIQSSPLQMAHFSQQTCCIAGSMGVKRILSVSGWIEKLRRLAQRKSRFLTN